MLVTYPEVKTKKTFKFQRKPPNRTDFNGKIKIKNMGILFRNIATVQELGTNAEELKSMPK